MLFWNISFIKRITTNKSLLRTGVAQHNELSGILGLVMSLFLVRALFIFPFIFNLHVFCVYITTSSFVFYGIPVCRNICVSASPCVFVLFLWLFFCLFYSIPVCLSLFYLTLFYEYSLMPIYSLRRDKRVWVRTWEELGARTVWKKIAIFNNRKKELL